jgi:hypothetical protein
MIRNSETNESLCFGMCGPGPPMKELFTGNFSQAIECTVIAVFLTLWGFK